MVPHCLRISKSILQILGLLGLAPAHGFMNAFLVLPLQCKVANSPVLHLCISYLQHDFSVDFVFGEKDLDDDTEVGISSSPAENVEWLIGRYGRTRVKLYAIGFSHVRDDANSMSHEQIECILYLS